MGGPKQHATHTGAASRTGPTVHGLGRRRRRGEVLGGGGGGLPLFESHGIRSPALGRTSSKVSNERSTHSYFGDLRSSAIHHPSQWARGASENVDRFLLLQLHARVALSVFFFFYFFIFILRSTTMPSILSSLSPRDQLAAAAADFYQVKQHSSSSSQPTWPRQAAAPTNDGKPGSLGISPLGAQIIITQVVMSILAVAWTGMRVWARRNRRISPFVIEDVLCYVALVGSLTYITCLPKKKFRVWNWSREQSLWELTMILPPARHCTWFSPCS